MPRLSRRAALASMAGAIGAPALSLASPDVASGLRIAAAPLALPRPFYVSRLVRAPSREAATMLARFFHAGLVSRSLDGSLTPGLAEAWRPEPDATRWVFDLDPRVRAAHLIPYLNWLGEANSPHGYSPLFHLQARALVREWRALDDRRLVAELHYFHPEFPAIVSDPFWLIPARAGGAGWFPTGPYRFAHDRRDSETGVGVMTFVPARNAHLDASSSAARGFEVRFLASATERLQAVLSGEVHLALGLGTIARAHFESARARGVSFIQTQPLSVTAIEVRAPSHPGLQAELAGALKRALPRSTLLAHVAPVAGRIVDDVPLGLLPPATASSTAPDPDAVRELHALAQRIGRSGIRYVQPNHGPLARGVAAWLTRALSRPIRAVREAAPGASAPPPLVSLRAWPRLPEPLLFAAGFLDQTVGGASLGPSTAIYERYRAALYASTSRERDAALASFAATFSTLAPAAVPFAVSSLTALAPGLSLPSPPPARDHVLLHDRLVASLLDLWPLAG